MYIYTRRVCVHSGREQTLQAYFKINQELIFSLQKVT